MKVGRLPSDKLGSNSVHETLSGRRGDEMSSSRMGGSDFIMRKSVNEL